MDAIKNGPRVEVVYDYKHEAAGDKPGTVWVRVYFSRTRRKYISTGVRVCVSEWSDEYHVINRPDALQLNTMIVEQVEKCKAMLAESLHEDKPEPDTRQMKVDRSDASFMDWLGEAVEQDPYINDDTRKHHRTTHRLVCEHGKMRRFEHVTEKNLRDWLKWIAEREVMKPLDGKMHPVKISQGTVRDHWKRLSKYLRLAVKDRRIPATAYDCIKVDRGEEALREHLNDAEIEKWLNTKMTTPCLEMARLRFIVQMGCGLAYKDFMTKDFSRAENVNGRWCLVDRRSKTKKEFFTVILPFAVEVLEMWNWEIPPISNVDYNKFLDSVAIACGIQKHVTSHIARHTYACYCLRHGVRIEAVQRTLGHKNIKTTQIYARLVGMDVLDAFDALK